MGAPKPSNKSAAFTSGRNIEQKKPGEEYKAERAAKKARSAAGGGAVGGTWGPKKKKTKEEMREKSQATMAAIRERLAKRRQPMSTAFSGFMSKK